MCEILEFKPKPRLRIKIEAEIVDNTELVRRRVAKQMGDLWMAYIRLFNPYL